MLELVAKLLNQAENAANEAEAAAFMERAQTIATTHSIDLARARHITIDKQRTVPVQRSIHIGDKGTKGLRTHTDLYLGIARANDIRCTIAHDATRVYAYGFAEDIDVSEALFASLLTQMVTESERFKKVGAWREEKVWRESTRSWSGGEYRPQTWLTARLEFQDAYASRISTRLYGAKHDEEVRQIRLEQEQAKRPHLTDDGVPTVEFNLWVVQNHGIDLNDLEDESGTASELCDLLRDLDDDWTQELLGQWKADLADQANRPGTALVLASKREAVDEFYAPAKKRARGSYRGSHQGGSSPSGRTAGAAAANRASLGGRTSIGGVRGAINA
jgi:hypothetical protein